MKPENETRLISALERIAMSLEAIQGQVESVFPWMAKEKVTEHTHEAMASLLRIEEIKDPLPREEVMEMLGISSPNTLRKHCRKLKVDPKKVSRVIVPKLQALCDAAKARRNNSGASKHSKKEKKMRRAKQF